MYIWQIKHLQKNPLFKKRMKFLKPKGKYLTTELQGNISNILRFELKDLYNIDKNQEFQTCLKCNALLAFNNCIFCGTQSQNYIDEVEKKNFICQKVQKTEKKSFQSMILCIDMSGSMECSYPSKYKKINKDYVIRSIGQKNFNTISAIITEDQVIKHFKGIQDLYKMGQSIKDIAYIFKDEINRQKQMKFDKTQKKGGQKPAQNKEEQEALEYITRKQIIEVGISKYIERIKKDRPKTLITVVYFNSHIQIPIDNFTDKLFVPDLETKTVQEMIEIGETHADLISIQPVTEVGQKLINNIANTKADGQTALAPALAFCLGLAKKFKHDLHQIVLVTDGLSNVGFGQTENEGTIEHSKQIFKRLALDYAIPYSCVVNVIGFQDCAISYDVIDQIVSKSGGIPYNISFANEKNEKTVVKDTIQDLNFEMISGFCLGTKQFFYETKIGVRASNKNIKISCDPELKKFIKHQQQNSLSLELGIKSVNDKLDFVFNVDNPEFEDEYIKFTVIAQYRRKNKFTYAVREDLISVKKGYEEQAIKDQGQALANQINQKLKVKLEEENFEEFKKLEEKIAQNAKISQHIDEGLLEQFKKRKQKMEEYDKTTDKLTKDKRSMMSRRHETYKRREANEDDEEEDDGFL